MSAAESLQNKHINWPKLFFMFLGPILFLAVYYSPPWPDAIDPLGVSFSLSPEAKGAIAVFLWAGVWWVFEVVPIGVTSLLIGTLQALFFIRPAREAFRAFMDPSVLFIFGSIVIGMVFTKTGLTKRLAYKMLKVVGERTSMIYLGCFFITAFLTLFMAHTAVAATVYPLLLAIYGLYGEGDKVTKFGKGLFIGMAYVAGAGSIICLLGAARGIVALGFYKDLVGKNVTFFEYFYYNLPLGGLMTVILWALMMFFFKPEKATIPGLRKKVIELDRNMGPVTRNEILAGVVVLSVIAFMSLQSFVPALAEFNKSAVLLVSTIIFFSIKILDINDLEAIPWNIILLFAGAMSIGFCLWETGAAQWLAVNWLTIFQNAHWFVFVLGMTLFVLIMTNFIMNVAAIAISLPVALVVAPYLGVSGEVILFASLAAAGMPFLLLVGAAPNAIAYDSRQFTSGEFFKYGAVASAILMVMIGVFVMVVWPIMGMEVTLPAAG